MAITNDFIEEYGQPVAKKVIQAKIEDIAKKERRKEDGDIRAVWHVLPEYMNLLTVDTIRHLRKEKESRLEKKRGGSRKKKKNEDEGANENGAIGPDGTFVDFPEYDGSEEPRECKKAFTLFCTSTRKQVKRSLPHEHRKDREKVNKLLKEKWFELSDEERNIWKKWQSWDRLRYARDLALHRKKIESSEEKSNEKIVPETDSSLHIPKKRRDIETNNDNGSNGGSSFHIPKKKRS